VDRKSITAQSVGLTPPVTVEPTYLARHGHEVINLTFDDDDFASVLATAQAKFDGHQSQVIVGSS
jgi:hypothetical protein